LKGSPFRVLRFRDDGKFGKKSSNLFCHSGNEQFFR
jgi:hypothetical protein